MAAKLAAGVWNRKAGRYDYDRFDHITSTSASVGYQSIGKVRVACRFLFRQSEWGTLGPFDNAAGIIYMELEFDQPPDCALESATIQMTLDEDDPGLAPYRSRSLPASECPILITDYYGPGQIVGTAKSVLVKKSLQFEPSVDIAGTGGSLGGMTREKEIEHESRWTFRTHRVPENKHNGRHWCHRTLRWEMTETKITKSTHSNRVYTAFAYEHGGQPFLMRIEISGKLRKQGDRLKAKLRKFGPRTRKQEDISTTLIGAYRGHRRPLDELAKGLASAMEWKNYLSPPIMVHDTTLSANPTVEFVPAGTSNHTSKIATTSQPEVHLEGQSLNTLDGIQLPALRDRSIPTLENLARAGKYLTVPARQIAVHRDPSQTRSHVSADESVAMESEILQTQLEPRRETGTVPENGDQAAAVPDKVDRGFLAGVMEVAFLRFLLQNFFRIIDFLLLGELVTRD